MRNRILISLVAPWLTMTCFVDFMVVPTVFRTVTELFVAGSLGIKVFTAFNYFEVVFAVGILGIFLSFLKQKSIYKVEIIVSVLLMFIAIFYITYLTPKISELTVMWENADQFVPGTKTAASEMHAFYHDFYIKMDSVKLILLLIMHSFVLFKKYE